MRPGDEYTWHYLNYFVEKSREYGHLEALLRYWVDGEQWKKDFLEKNDGVSAIRQELVNFLGIADYTPYVGKTNRLTMR